MRSNTTNITIPTVARRLLLTAAVLLGLASCSTDETVYDEDPIDGTAETDVGGVAVEDGTEGGLELDNGNVPGSTNDDDLDPFDEQLDLNTDDDTVE